MPVSLASFLMIGQISSAPAAPARGSGVKGVPGTPKPPIMTAPRRGSGDRLFQGGLVGQSHAAAPGAVSASNGPSRIIGTSSCGAKPSRRRRRAPVVHGPERQIARAPAGRVSATAARSRAQPSPRDPGWPRGPAHRRRAAASGREMRKKATPAASPCSAIRRRTRAGPKPWARIVSGVEAKPRRRRFVRSGPASRRWRGISGWRADRHAARSLEPGLGGERVEAAVRIAMISSICAR